MDRPVVPLFPSSPETALECWVSIAGECHQGPKNSLLEALWAHMHLFQDGTHHVAQRRSGPGEGGAGQRCPPQEGSSPHTACTTRVVPQSLENHDLLDLPFNGVALCTCARLGKMSPEPFTPETHQCCGVERRRGACCPHPLSFPWNAGKSHLRPGGSPRLEDGAAPCVHRSLSLAAEPLLLHSCACKVGGR